MFRSMFHHSDPEVLVVGAGPVGLVAALFLQQHGVRVEVVDMDEHTTRQSYALAIHPRTLRILDEAGLSERLIGAGRKLTKVAYYEGRERRAEIDYSALASKHPYLLVVRQSLLERAAEEALRQKKLKVLWGHRLESLNADETTLRAEVAQLDQVATGYLLEEFATETHQAWQWLLGAGGEARALSGADPWVRQTRARILACVPASGDDLELLLGQMGLTAATRGRDAGLGA